MPKANIPVSIKLRTYQVGFSDCFLLTFKYDAGGNYLRHILIDFGTTKRPANGPTLVQIAEDIKTECSGKLHAVVATHRHADHISGFAGRSGEIIASLKPDVVLQPWTEDFRASVHPSNLGGFCRALMRPAANNFWKSCVCSTRR